MNLYVFHCLLLTTLIAFIYGGPLNIIHVTDDNDNIDNVIKKGVEAAAAGATIATVKITNSMTESEVCAAILKANAAPSVAIDTTMEFRDTTSRASTIAKNVLRKMGLPTLSTTPGVSHWSDLTDQEAVYLTSIQPPATTMFEAIKSIAIKLEMKKIMIFYDETFDPIQKQSTTFVNTNIKAAFEAISKSSDGLIVQTNSVFFGDYGNVFILGKMSTINEVIEKVSNLSMFKPQHKWFMMTKDDPSDDIKCADNVNGSLLVISPVKGDVQSTVDFSKLTVTSAQKIDMAFYYDVGALVAKLGEDWATPLTYAACGEALTEEQAAERATATLSDKLKAADFIGYYGKFNFEGNLKNKQLIKLQFKYLFFNATDGKKEDSGSWAATPTDGGTLQLNNEAVLKSKLLLRITTIEQHPFIYKNYDENNNVYFTGYCIDLIDNIKKVDTLNFEYRIFENAEKRFGDMTEEGPNNISWKGMIGDLYYDRADIALGPLAVMAERETVVDFTVPYYDLVGISILMKKPDIKSSLFKFLTVLETNVWGCILGAYFFTSVLMYLFDRLSPYSFHNNREKLKDDPENRDFNLKECLWFCMTSLTPQGGGEAPRNLSGRLVAATWWLFGFIIIASYTANLAAFLTVSRLDSTIESLDDLARQYKIKYAPVKNTEAEQYFKRMAQIEERFYEIWKNMSLDDTLNETERAKLAVWDYPVSDKYTKIWWTMSEGEKQPKLFSEGVAKVLESKGPSDGFALVGDSTMIKYATMTFCKLVQVGSEFSRKPLALAVQQGSPYKDLLSSAILKLLNERTLETLKEQWWTSNPFKVKCDDKEKQSDGISISNIGGVFIVIFIGVVLACITLAIEFCYFKHKRNNTRVIAVKDMTIQSKDQMKR